MIIDTFRWVAIRCRSYDHASDDSTDHKMGWLEVGTKLHCIEQSGHWFRFDSPKMPLITADYPHTWAHDAYLQATPITPEPQPEPTPIPVPVPGGTVTREQAAAAIVTLLNYILGR